MELLHISVVPRQFAKLLLYVLTKRLFEILKSVLFECSLKKLKNTNILAFYRFSNSHFELDLDVDG